MQLESSKARICLCIFSTISCWKNRRVSSNQQTVVIMSAYIQLSSYIVHLLPLPPHLYNHSWWANKLHSVKPNRTLSVLSCWSVRHHSWVFLDTHSFFLPLWLLLLSLLPRLLYLCLSLNTATPQGFSSSTLLITPYMLSHDFHYILITPKPLPPGLTFLLDSGFTYETIYW